MSEPRKLPLDQPVRDRLVSDFGTNFLVEAGAGSGKTYSLATRMAAGIAVFIRCSRTPGAWQSIRFTP